MALHNDIPDPVVASAVEIFYARITDDPSLASWFEGIELTRLKAHQRAFLTVCLGGPELYSGRSMRHAHAGLAITNDAFSAALAHLSEALTAAGVDASVRDQAVRRFEPLRAVIVEQR